MTAGGSELQVMAMQWPLSLPAPPALLTCCSCFDLMVLLPAYIGTYTSCVLPNRWAGAEWTATPRDQTALSSFGHLWLPDTVLCGQLPVSCFAFLLGRCAWLLVGYIKEQTAELRFKAILQVACIKQSECELPGLQCTAWNLLMRGGGRSNSSWELCCTHWKLAFTWSCAHLIRSGEPRGLC